MKQQETFNRTKRLSRSIRNIDLNNTLNTYLIEMMFNQTSQLTDNHFKFKPSNNLKLMFKNLLQNSTKTSSIQAENDTLSTIANELLKVCTFREKNNYRKDLLLL